MVNKTIINSEIILKRMVKRGTVESNGRHPLFHERLTLGQRAADNIAKFGGSWAFVLFFIGVIIVWIILNGILLSRQPFDPFPFVLLNLTLSTVAALQAPIILMSQNRQTERDRIDAQYDYQVNLKAEREIQDVKRELVEIKRMLKK